MEKRQKVTGWVVVKAINSQERRIGGYFSTRYTDREGEEFAPEAFAASIAPGGSYYANPVLLYNHDAGRLIGKADVTTLGYDEVGAYGEFIVSDDEAWGQIERGELRAFSWYGFIDPTKSQIRMDGSIQIPVHHAVDLVEVTVTPIPCNPGALFEVRSKAVTLGKAADADFPAGQAAEERSVSKSAEKQKSVYLGTYAESDMAIAALYSLGDRLMWKVADVMEAQATDPGERVEIVEAMFAEFSEIGLRTISAILAGTAAETKTEAVKQIRALWKPPVQPEPAKKTAAPEGDDIDMTPEEMQALVAQEASKAITAAIPTIVQGVTTAMGSQKNTPAEPAAKPEGELEGEPASKSLGSEAELDQLATKLLEKAGVKPGATKGLVEDDRGGEAASTKRYRGVVETANKAREAGFGTTRAKNLLDGALREACAFEATGGKQGYHDLGEGE